MDAGEGLVSENPSLTDALRKDGVFLMEPADRGHVGRQDPREAADCTPDLWFVDVLMRELAQMHGQEMSLKVLNHRLQRAAYDMEAVVLPTTGTPDPDRVLTAAARVAAYALLTARASRRMAEGETNA